MSAGLVSRGASLLALQSAASSLGPHRVLPLCIPGVSSSSCQDIGPVGSGPHPYDLINRNHLPKGPSPAAVTLGVRASTFEFARGCAGGR